MNQYGAWTQNAKWTRWNGAVFTPLAKQPVTPPVVALEAAIAPAQVATPVTVPDAPTVDASAETTISPAEQLALFARLDLLVKQVAELGATIAKRERDIAFYQGELAMITSQRDREHSQRLIAEASYRSLSKRISQDQQDKSVEVSLAHA